jgi:hypothetical protein
VALSRKFRHRNMIAASLDVGDSWHLACFLSGASRPGGPTHSGGTMIKKLIVIASMVAAVAAPARAQQTRQSTQDAIAPEFQVSPYVGYMIFGDYLKGPIGTSLSTKNGAVYGAQLGMNLTPSLSLLGNVGYSSSNLQIGVPILGGVSVGSSNVWLYDADLQLSMPRGKAQGSLPVSPFVQVGAGAMTVKLSNGLINTSGTNFTGNAGVGVDIAAARNIDVRLMAKDYIGRFNFKDATGLGIQGNTANNIALTGGVRIAF